MILRLSRSAADDLQEIWRYTEGRWGEGQADAYLDALGKRLFWLADHPGLWSESSPSGSGVFRFLHERHAIYFRVEESALEVIRILHQRMDPSIHLE